MKLAQILVVGVVAATLVVSCGDESGGGQSRDVENHATHSGSAETKDGLEGLKLDDGRRWKMDEHTRSVFAKMATSFLDSDERSLEGEGLKKAGSELQVLVDELIRGCTMTGAAHDQLHVYLMGYMPAVAAVANSGRTEDAKKVRRYLEEYDEYFE